ncbi:MAG: 5-deoxy-glucuronate isomerase [Actinomycetota bacterium]
MEHEHIYRPSGGSGVQFAVTPDSAGWQYLSFSVVSLAAGEAFASELADQETAIVPLSGSGTLTAGGETYQVSRTSVFAQMPEVLYLPPGVAVQATTDGAFEFSIGSAPAEGLYPQRLFTPPEMKTEMRGGGAAYRQICHVLAPPIPAERLILYEVYVPRGTWSGWAPHCHDGYDGSPYLEEVYWFKLDPSEGFAMHRNWRVDEPFDETLVLNDGDCALVTKGYHSSVACPGSNMYFLNYLAGELVDSQRTTPPCFHDDFTWIDEAWDNGDEGAWTLPVVSP